MLLWRPKTTQHNHMHFPCVNRPQFVVRYAPFNFCCGKSRENGGEIDAIFSKNKIENRKIWKHANLNIIEKQLHCSINLRLFIIILKFYSLILVIDEDPDRKKSPFLTTDTVEKQLSSPDLVNLFVISSVVLGIV